ncbi:MAG: peptide deformylase [Rickettsiales bacterium]|nr:peptide deformylase [Rickettsiales bacterium]|tara:strand:- start:1306 stop:1860 length:555 start_codon:yes stop_codon:yes gene_type:complete
MAILPIIEVPDPLLSQASRPVESIGADVHKLLDDMAETMFAAPGIGLAAVQVGVPQRILIAAVPVRDGISREEQDDQELGSAAYLCELINPVVTERKGSICYEEGCLSVPDMTVEVDRSEQIRISALDRNGKEFSFVAEGFYAVVFQHELDHLDGVTLLSHMGPLRRKLFLKKLKKRRAGGQGS